MAERRDDEIQDQEGRGALFVVTSVQPALAQKTVKPVLHGRHWVAITGKLLAATAGTMMFAKGGNGVDAACAMIAATSTMWDVLSWGGETQALIYNPNTRKVITRKVIGINALGVALTGVAPDYYGSQGRSIRLNMARWQWSRQARQAAYW